jgi:hypothetical protein
MIYDRLPLVTASQSGLPQSDRVISALQQHQLPVFSAEHQGLLNPSRRPAMEGFLPISLMKVSILQPEFCLV